MPIQTNVLNRKIRRKEERNQKKLKRRPRGHSEEELSQKQEEPGQEEPQRPLQKKPKTDKIKKKVKDAYAHLSPDVAEALRRDDDEIAELEVKLGLATKKEKLRLHKEYAKLEGFGDDFGGFLDEIDDLVTRVVKGENDEGNQNEDEGDTGSEEDSMGTGDSSDEEEIVPMKDPADQLDDDDSVLDEIEAEERAKKQAFIPKIEDNSQSDESTGLEENNEDTDEDEQEGQDPDHDVNDTYYPSRGEDIYGNKVDAPSDETKPTKYIPPHLRDNNTEIDKDREESLRNLNRLLNNALNRLSEDTLLSVAQSIVQVYPSFPTTDVNEAILNNVKNACIINSQVMTGLIPVYVAALVGVHIEMGDTAQLGEYLVEMCVTNLWFELEKVRKTNDSIENSDIDSLNKDSSNLLLILCYLYNFGVVHCSLLYDLIRNLATSFKEVDVELLLLLLSHCGRAIRSDDPMSLKEIVILVQQRLAKEAKPSSRTEYMVAAMMDLKNNKRRQQDTVFAEKATKLRKLLGAIKSKVASNKSGFHAAETSLRITLQDILDAESKGRWWKVGASWLGNQNRLNKSQNDRVKEMDEVKSSGSHAEDVGLLQLAAKYRMNSDARRSIFCIIMGAADCEDAFEKLVKAGMLKNRTERDTVRVLIECCGNEKAYNKFYSHLASRLCEFQQECRFSFQLAFWDIFKQFDEMKARKAANVAKLLFHLVAVDRVIKLNVLKAVDISSPEELPETAMIFLTIFLSSVLEHFEEPSDCYSFFQHGISDKKSDQSKFSTNGEDELSHVNEGEALRASLTVFNLQVLKKSPKYKKGSRFRANLKAAIKACDTDNFF